MTDTSGPDETGLAVEQRAFVVGDRTYSLRPFKGSKGVRAFAIISRVGDRLTDIWKAAAQYEAEYRQMNVQVIDRDAIRYQTVTAENVKARLEADLQDVSPEAIAAKREEYVADRAAAEGSTDDDRQRRIDEAQAKIDDLKLADDVRDQLQRALRAQDRAVGDAERMLARLEADGADSLRIPQRPSKEQVFMAVFPVAWGIAERELTMLIGLVLIEDAELKQARADGRVDEALLGLGDQVLDELEIDEVAELVLAAVEFGLQRYRPRIARLEKTVGRLREIITPSQTEAENRDTAEPDPGVATEDQLGPDLRNTEPIVGSVELPSPEMNSPSSTDSPPPTAGTPTASSTASSGQISSS